MNYLIDIGHPAHVHYFRNLYWLLVQDNKVVVTCKDVPIIKGLLDHYQIPYIVLGQKGEGMLGKIKQQCVFTTRMKSLLIDHAIDIAYGASALVVHGSKLTKTHCVMFDDDDQHAQPFTAKLVTPFAKTILSPDALKHENLNNAIYYPGYHELAYLHPSRFKPNPDILKKYGLTEHDKYYILRFNAFKAHHDIREGGMNNSQKMQLIDMLQQYGKVFVTTEAKLSPQFEKYKLPIAPHEIHDFMYYAQMLVSDSQTMSTEAAVMGTPSFRCNSFAGRLAVLEEEEKKYGITYAFLPRQFDWMLGSINKHLRLDDGKSLWLERKNRLLNDKIDVTAFWAWFLREYPLSRELVRSREFTYERFMQEEA